MNTLDVVKKYSKNLKSDFKGLVKYYLEYAEYHIKNQLTNLSEKEIRVHVSSEIRNLLEVMIDGEEKKFLLSLKEELIYQPLKGE